jgi:NADPH:quinone reductase-like Zn-dependent oxidoreductase
MYAMVLSARGAVLTFQERPDPTPGPGEVRIKVSACGVCRTDLHVVDGELPHICYPIIPGHEVVGRIDALGARVSDLKPGMRVGVPGSATPAANASIATRTGRISAIIPNSPAIRATAALLVILSPKPDTAFRSVNKATTWHFRPCSARA